MDGCASPGILEYREAFGPQGRYGRWLRTKSTVLQLGDTVFMHAGINPERAARRLEDINKQVTSDIKRFDEYRSRLIDRQLILPSFMLTEILTAAQIEVAITAALSKSPNGTAGVARGGDDAGSPQARRTPSHRPMGAARP